MEVAQREDDGLELPLLGARLEHLLGEVVVRAGQILLHPLGGFVGQLDAVLQEGDGEAALQRGRGFRGQEQPEVFVRPLGELVHRLLQRAVGPVNREVDVLQEHPPAALVEVLQIVHRDGLLALPQRDARVLAVVGGVPELAPEVLHRRRDVHAGGEEDEHGRARRRIFERRRQVKGIRRDVPLAEGVLDEGAERVGHPVRSQRPEQQQLLELLHLLPVARHRFLLRSLQLHPLAPALGGAHEVVPERGVLLKLADGVDHLPVGLAEPLRQRVVHALGPRGSEQPVEQLRVQLALLPKDSHGELRRHDELVPLEETGGDVPEHRGRDALGERGDALLDGQLLAELLLLGHPLLPIAAAGADIHPLLEDVDVVRHRVLVHAVEHVEHVDEEVEQRAARRDGPVHLAGLVDRDLSLRRNLDFFGDFRRRSLRLFQILDESDVLEDVALGVGEANQQVILELRELHGVLSELSDEVGGLLLQVEPLLLDDEREELIFQTLLRDAEIHQSRLRRNLGFIVRVGELRLEVELEVRVVVHLLVAELHHRRPAAFHRLSSHDGVEDGVDVVLEVFNHQRDAVLDAVLHVRDVVGLGELDDLELVAPLLLDPLDALELGVDHERPSLGGGHDGAVLDGQRVGG